MIPYEAELEIKKIIATNLEIYSDELEQILKKHGVEGDPDALQVGFRKGVGQKYMASYKDKNGNREFMAVPGKGGKKRYVPVRLCTDRMAMMAAYNQMHKNGETMGKNGAKVLERMKEVMDFVKSFVMEE